MSINSKVLAAAATLLLVTGTAVASGTTPAFALTGHEVCDQGSPVECLNAWNGGPNIKTYSPNVSNNNFVVQGVDRCNDGDLSTSNCPIKGNPSGLFIYQVEYVGGGTFNGKCVGDNGSGAGTMTLCNSTGYPGSGGGAGTIFVAWHGDGSAFPFCNSGFNYGISARGVNSAGGWANPADLHGIGWLTEQNGQAVGVDTIFFRCLSYIPFG